MIYNSYDNVGLIKVLKFLKSHKSEYLSGQDLSQVLKISRVAVWKHVKKIKTLGYKIDSKQNLGYRLTENTDIPLPWEITNNIKTKVIGKRAYFFDVIDSTQNYALTIASNQKENGSVVIAQRQTSGRGRHGRKWSSPVGGIWLSIILHPKFDISYTTLFPIASSLALALAIENTLRIKPELKWPNDVTINGKKVAGMLVDITVQSNKIESLILGVGINFKIDEKKVNKSLKGTPNFYGASSLIKKNETKNSIVFIQSFLFELEQIFEQLNQGNLKSIIKRWSNRSSTIGKKISISTSDKKIVGKAVKIDSDGALVIMQGKKTEKVLVGDVNYIQK